MDKEVIFKIIGAIGTLMFFWHLWPDNKKQCEKCGLWKSKLFVEHILRETKIYTECPIPKEELKSAKTVVE